MMEELEETRPRWSPHEREPFCNELPSQKYAGLGKCELLIRGTARQLGAVSLFEPYSVMM
jgi:hypothetical protein